MPRCRLPAQSAGRLGCWHSRLRKPKLHELAIHASGSSAIHRAVSGSMPPRRRSAIRSLHFELDASVCFWLHLPKRTVLRPPVFGHKQDRASAHPSPCLFQQLPFVTLPSIFSASYHSTYSSATCPLVRKAAPPPVHDPAQDRLVDPGFLVDLIPALPHFAIPCGYFLESCHRQYTVLAMMSSTILSFLHTFFQTGSIHVRKSSMLYRTARPILQPECPRLFVKVT